MTAQRHAAIVGAGLIGLTIARALVARGWAVTVFERARAGRGAAWAAAGMLAPNAESVDEDGLNPAFETLGRASLALWPDWAAELERASGETIGLDRSGALVVAFDGAGAAGLDAAAARLAAGGVRAEMLIATAARRLCPALAPDIAGALSLPDDIAVDARRATHASLRAARAQGVKVREGVAVADVEPGARPVVRWSGGEAAFDAVVIAAGFAAPGFTRFPQLGAITPVKGQMIALADPDGTVSRVVRGPGAYLCPRREEARVVVGASVEPGLDDDLVDEAVGRELALSAARLIPALKGAAILERWAGVRPGSPDHAPLLGPVGENVHAACGHHRNGVLLAPITGALLAASIADGAAPEAMRPFGADRFHVALTAT